MPAPLRRAQRRSHATLRVPHRKHGHLARPRNVVDVIARSLKQDTTRPWDRRMSICSADARCIADDVERSCEFVKEQIRRRRTAPPPPVVDLADLCVCFGSGSYRQAHRRWRNSSRIADTGRRRPVSVDFQDADSASCRARRSSSVRSSPSSSATRSTTVPSGKVVGSSRTSRPFSTRARKPLMCLLYGFPSYPASVNAVTESVEFAETRDDLVPTGGHWGTSRLLVRTWTPDRLSILCNSAQRLVRTWN
jgi:hypothetical protein